MPKQSWTQEEDLYLKHLCENLKMKSWILIAKTISENNSMTYRSAKQCRQRFHNHLDTAINKTDWTPEEEAELFRCHDQIGNKWACIAKRLNGRTDNCVKNHFYSKLRKAIRKLNKVILEQYPKDYKQIKTSVLYKIIEASEMKFKKDPLFDHDIAIKSNTLKNRLLQYSSLEESNASQQMVISLISDTLSFSKEYKRMSKKNRKASFSTRSLVRSNGVSNRASYDENLNRGVDSDYNCFTPNTPEPNLGYGRSFTPQGEFNHRNPWEKWEFSRPRSEAGHSTPQRLWIAQDVVEEGEGLLEDEQLENPIPDVEFMDEENQMVDTLPKFLDSSGLSKNEHLCTQPFKSPQNKELKENEDNFAFFDEGDNYIRDIEGSFLQKKESIFSNNELFQHYESHPQE